MKLYFVRHATASSKTDWAQDDALRPLTRGGKERFRALAVALAKAGVLDSDLILTSPLVRARETAKLLADTLATKTPVQEDPRLGAGFDLAALSGILAEHADVDSLAIVGHNPGFAEVLSAVIGGGEVDMRKGAIALVELDDPSRPEGRLLWLAPPSIFAGRE